MVQSIKDAGIPSALSYTAGSYVCNYLMYTLLYLIDKKYPNIRGGFIHVPYAMEQVVNKPLGTPSMDLHQIARGLEKAVEAVVKNDADPAVNMGTTTEHPRRALQGTRCASAWRVLFLWTLARQFPVRLRETGTERFKMLRVRCAIIRGNIIFYCNSKICGFSGVAFSPEGSWRGVASDTGMTSHREDVTGFLSAKREFSFCALAAGQHQPMPLPVTTLPVKKQIRRGRSPAGFAKSKIILLLFMPRATRRHSKSFAFQRTGHFP